MVFDIMYCITIHMNSLNVYRLNLYDKCRYSVILTVCAKFKALGVVLNSNLTFTDHPICFQRTVLMLRWDL